MGPSLSAVRQQANKTPVEVAQKGERRCLSKMRSFSKGTQCYNSMKKKHNTVAEMLI